MGYVGVKPSAVPLTSADIADGIITSAKIVDGTIVNADINASAAIAGTKLTGVGKVLQVLQTAKSDGFSTTSATYVDITDLTLNITPSSASNKVLIFFQVTGSSTGLAYVRISRGGTDIASGTGSGSRVSATTGNFSNTGDGNRTFNYFASFLDSPNTTSSTTYAIQARCENSGVTLNIGKGSDGDGAFSGRYISTIQLLEIAG
jgi:hypothetical protein